MFKAWALAGTLAAATVCFAGPLKGGDGTGHQGKFKKTVAELNLTDQQKSQMHDIIKSAKQKERQEIKSLLTKQQKQQLRSLKSELKAGKQIEQ